MVLRFEVSAVYDRISLVMSEAFVTWNLLTTAWLELRFMPPWPLLCWWLAVEGPGGGSVSLCYIRI